MKASVEQAHGLASIYLRNELSQLDSSQDLSDEVRQLRRGQIASITREARKGNLGPLLHDIALENHFLTETQEYVSTHLPQPNFFYRYLASEQKRLLREMQNPGADVDTLRRKFAVTSEVVLQMPRGKEEQKLLDIATRLEIARSAAEAVRYLRTLPKNEQKFTKKETQFIPKRTLPPGVEKALWVGENAYFVLANAGDLLSTYIGINQFGLREANILPIVALDHYGFGSLIVLKLGITFAALVGNNLLRKNSKKAARVTQWVLNGLLTAATVSNALQEVGAITLPF